MYLGDNLNIISGIMPTPMGRNVKASLRVGPQAVLSIGNNVGMTSVAIFCMDSIIIGDNVKVGALTIISDSDAPSMDPMLTANPETDTINAKHAPIIIKNNAFIGAMCYINKGVSIGENSIVGACSVVTKNIPDNEIWAGNPARFIKRID